MSSHLGPAIANTFLSYHEKSWLNNCPKGFKSVFYRRYVDDIFIPFRSNGQLKYFQDFLNSCHINKSFSIETVKDNKLFFLDIEITCKQDKFTTTVYRKLTFSGACSNFEGFLVSVHIFWYGIYFSL